MKSFKTYIILITFGALMPVSLWGADKNPDDDLANVAILRFQNNTGSKNYTWLETSLADAVHESMQKRFEYKRDKPAKVQATVDKMRKKWKTKKLSNKQVEEIAKKTGAHVVIYGNFVLNDKTKEIEFQAKVFHYDGNRVIGQAVTTSPIDNRLFNSTDEVAARIVDHIYKFVTAQLAAEKKEDKPKKEQKLAINKKIRSSGNNNGINVELLGGGIYGSLGYIRTFELGIKWHGRVQAAVVPRPDLTFIHLRLGLAAYLWNFYLEIGPAIYDVTTDSSDGQGTDGHTDVGGFVSLGYAWEVIPELIVRPALYFIGTGSDRTPFVGISGEYRF